MTSEMREKRSAPSGSADMKFAQMMHVMTCAGLLVTAAFAQEMAADAGRREKVEAALTKVGKGIPNEEVVRNYDLLLSPRFEDLPVLLEHLDEESELAGCIQEPRMVRDETTGRFIRWRKSTTGDLAFLSIVYLIEGARPLRYGSFYVLDRRTIRAWLAERKDRTLLQLRAEAAEEGLKKALKLHADHESDDTRKFVAVMQERIPKILEGENPKIGR